MKKTLVILAAGMGSRYGGLKQVDTLGSNGESIIDFTIYDAIQAGFEKLILIIRKEHEEIFENNVVGKMRPFIDIEFAFQDINDIPEGCKVPEERKKPWGTTHALLATRHILKDDPFVICNADDFYGRDAFKKVAKFFEDSTNPEEYCMVGYKVENTLSENGTVTRGVCKKNDNDELTAIKEVMNIRWNEKHDGVEFEEDGEYKPMDMGTPVSMNFWGFKPSVVAKMNEIFVNELPKGLETNPLKYEALLPNHVGQLVDEKKATVKVLTSEDSWFGVTYADDKPSVVAKIQSYKDNGTYPFNLWEKK